MTGVLEAPVGATSRRCGGICLLLCAVIAGAIVVANLGPPGVHVPAGLFCLFVLPVVLLTAKIDWPQSTKVHEALIYSVAIVILGDIVLGLAINEILPFVGVARPLDRTPTCIGLVVALAVLATWRPRRWRIHDGIAPQHRGLLLPRIALRDQLVLIPAVLMVVAAIVGAVRLNNGAEGAVTVGALLVGGAVLIAVFAWRNKIRESTIVLALYCVSVSLLLMTSLRGWFITGHDIQREFRMFTLTAHSGIWDIAAFRDAYNACLSLTILPTMIQRTTGMPDVYIFKTVFQPLYAVCPILIYLVARRFGAKSVAILAAMYVIAFPTFFTDMPFLNRQEVAFFFIGVALLVITDSQIAVRTRRIGFLACATGVILSHYSTTYVLLGVLAIGWSTHHLVRAFRRWRLHRRSDPGNSRYGPQRPTTDPMVVNWWCMLVIAGLTALWVGPLTGTGGVLEATFTSTMKSLSDLTGGQRASDASYTILGGAKVSPQTRLSDYRKQVAVTTTEENDNNQETYPVDEVKKYPTPIVADELLAPTVIGRELGRLGVSVEAVNSAIRSGAPMVLQLFVALGIVVVAAGRTSRFTPNLEYLSVAIASLFAVGLHIVLPEVSVNYGVLRTFAQGLFWLAPFIAVGSIDGFAWLGGRRPFLFAMSMASVFFLSLTGAVPELLGGYPPQLHLNNAGRYYDIYYVHPQEVSEIKWVTDRVAHDSGSYTHSEIATDRYALTRLQGYIDFGSADDIYPMVVRRDAYAFLGYTAVRRGTVTFIFSGDLVTYRYPVEFLDRNKDLVYSSNAAKVYR
jgi:uncharacterized membrane protein